MNSFSGKKPQIFYNTGDLGGGSPGIKPSSKSLTETVQIRFAKGFDSNFKGLVKLFAEMCAEMEPNFDAKKQPRVMEFASLRNDLKDILQQAAYANSGGKFIYSTKSSDESPVSTIVLSTRGLAVEASILPSDADTPLLRISTVTESGRTEGAKISPVNLGHNAIQDEINPRFTEAIEDAALLLLNHEPAAAQKKELDAKYVKRIDALLVSLQAIEGKEVAHDKFKPYFDELVAIIKEVASENKNLQFEFKESGSPSYSELSPNNGKHSLSISGKGDYGQYVEMSLALIRDYRRTRLDNGFACRSESSHSMSPRMLADELFRRNIVEAAEDVLNFDGRTLDNLNK